MLIKSIIMIPHQGKILKSLYKSKNLTQHSLAELLDVSRSQVQIYLQQDKLNSATIDKISKALQVDKKVFDEGIKENNVETTSDKDEDHIAGKHLRILPILVDKDDNERIAFVPIKAAGGYLTRFQDAKYIGQLPTFNLPNLRDGTYRAFEVEGDSMRTTINPNDIVICRYIDNWYHIMDMKIYLVVGVDNIGLIVKRLINRLKTDKHIVCISENEFYPPMVLSVDDVREIWEVKVKVSTSFEPPVYLDARFRRLEENIGSILNMVSKVITKD